MQIELTTNDLSKILGEYFSLSKPHIQITEKEIQEAAYSQNVKLAEFSRVESRIICTGELIKNE